MVIPILVLESPFCAMLLGDIVLLVAQHFADLLITWAGVASGVNNHLAEGVDIPQGNMAIAARVVGKVILMIVFSFIKAFERCNLNCKGGETVAVNFSDPINDFA